MNFLGYCLAHYCKSFGELLTLHRTHRGLSLRDLGAILNVDPATLSRWESGIRLPREKHKKNIKMFFEGDH